MIQKLHSTCTSLQKGEFLGPVVSKEVTVNMIAGPLEVIPLNGSSPILVEQQPSTPATEANLEVSLLQQLNIN